MARLTGIATVEFFPRVRHAEMLHKSLLFDSPARAHNERRILPPQLWDAPDCGVAPSNH
jgi:hypothetical protein